MLCGRPLSLEDASLREPQLRSHPSSVVTQDEAAKKPVSARVQAVPASRDMTSTPSDEAIPEPNARRIEAGHDQRGEPSWTSRMSVPDRIIPAIRPCFSRANHRSTVPAGARWHPMARQVPIRISTSCPDAINNGGNQNAPSRNRSGFRRRKPPALGPEASLVTCRNVLAGSAIGGACDFDAKAIPECFGRRA